MGTSSIVSGHIRIRSLDSMRLAREIIEKYPFDEIYPFTNIFWTESPAKYEFPIIGLAGSYKNLEQDFAEWLWKYSKFLSQLDALEAVVHLEGIWGKFSFTFEPRCVCKDMGSKWPDSFISQEWVITNWPEDDPWYFKPVDEPFATQIVPRVQNAISRFLNEQEGNALP